MPAARSPSVSATVDIFRLDALAAALRRRAAAVLAEDPAREPAAHRGQRLGRRGRHRGARELGPGRGAVEGDRVHAGARRPAGLHRRARRRRPRRDARRDGRRWAAIRRRSTRSCRPSSSSTTPCRSTRSARATRSLATPSASSSATRSATRSCAGARTRSTTSPSCRRTPASSTRSTSSTSRASCSSNERRQSPYPDTLVGTDSHTTMINGLGVLGWGVGGIEAEAAMLGQPMSMLIPQVRRLQAARRAARGRDGDRPRADRHRDAARARRRRQVRRVLRPRPRAACRSPTARRSAT